MLSNEKRRLVLEWLDEIVQNPEDFRSDCYSDSEMENMAADTMQWVLEQAKQIESLKKAVKMHEKEILRLRKANRTKEE